MAVRRGLSEGRRESERQGWRQHARRAADGRVTLHGAGQCSVEGPVKSEMARRWTRCHDGRGQMTRRNDEAEGKRRCEAGRVTEKKQCRRCRRCRQVRRVQGSAGRRVQGRARKEPGATNANPAGDVYYQQRAKELSLSLGAAPRGPPAVLSSSKQRRTGRVQVLLLNAYQQRSAPESGPLDGTGRECRGCPNSIVWGRSLACWHAPGIRARAATKRHGA